MNEWGRGLRKTTPMKRLEVLVLYNEPALSADDPDWAAEAGVLDSVEAVSAALLARGHRVRTLALAGTAVDVLESLPRADQRDVVFNLFEGLGGRRPRRSRNRGACSSCWAGR